LILLVILNFLLFKPILRVLDEREALVKDSSDLKKRLGGLAEENIQEYEAKLYSAKQDAMGIRTTRRSEALGEYRHILQEARDHGAEELEGARKKIAEQTEASRQTLQGEASSLARSIAAKLVGREL
jgi:F-type H+-transporting ATPase subunit b